MSADLVPGQEGWINYYYQYPVKVEYLGSGARDYEWPTSGYRYFRVITPSMDSCTGGVGDILEVRETDEEEVVMYTSQQAAIPAAIKYLQKRNESYYRTRADYSKCIETLQSLLM